MNRSIWLTLLAVLAFAVILIARLPASWVLHGPPSEVSCTEADGTIWHGSCSGMTARRQAIGDVSWEVHPARLLGGVFSASAVLTRASGKAQGTVEVGFGNTLTARDVHVDLPLDPALMPQLPPNLAGNVHADIALIRLKGNAITEIEGEVQARDLRLGVGGSAEPFGSYSLTFHPDAGDPIGQLHDLGGPLELQGTVRLTREPGFDLQCRVKTRPDAPEELVRDIQFLGSPDPQGWRPFSLAATF